MLEFRQLKIEDKQLFSKYLPKKTYLNSMTDFATFWLWNTQENFLIARQENLIIIKTQLEEKTIFYCPTAQEEKDIIVAVELIKQYMQGNPFFMQGISDSCINNDIQLENCEITTSENDSDYIYEVEALTLLKGKKLHSKRNFLNFFMANFNYEFVEYQEKYYQEIMDLFDSWNVHSHQNDFDEKSAISRALLYYKELDMKIGLILIDGKVQAFAVGCISQFNRAHMLFEKGNVDYKGIYVAINNFMQKQFFQNCKYVNREEDMGLENLRKSKQSLVPTIMYRKYQISCK